MQNFRSLLYVLFTSLLVGGFALGHAGRVVADDYAALPEDATATDPLQSGDRAPAFTVRTVEGEPYAFDPDNLERPTILISFRGGWCPYCNLHLSELRHAVPELRSMGFDVLFISNDAPDALYDSLQQETRADIESLDYTILSDADLQAARALGTAFRVDRGLTDYLDRNGTDYAGSSIGLHNALAVPAVYLVDRDGTIVYDYVNPDYKVRLSPEELLAAARSLR